MNYEEACIEVSKIFGETLNLWSTLFTFRSVCNNGLSFGVQIQIHQMKSFLNQMKESGEFAKILTDPRKANEALKEMLKSPIEEKLQKDVLGVVDATSIVFAHGILDACVYDYLKIHAFLKPECWEYCVANKKIEFQNIKGTSHVALREKLVNNFIEVEIERKSLLEKIGHLLRVAPPPDAKSLTDDFSYNEKRLKQFDETRHHIVHGNMWQPANFIVEQELSYCQRLTFYFCLLVLNATGLKIHPNHVFEKWNNQEKE